MTDAFRARRSALYMPASNTRALQKARSLDCDMVIIDLEDAVAPETKDEARGAAIATVAEGGFGRREVIVRVNASDTPWGSADLEALSGCVADGILVPKVGRPQDLAVYRAAVGKDMPLWAMIETCEAILNLRELAAAAEGYGVVGWVAGTNDLAKEMRCALTPERAPLIPALAMMVTAARSCGIAVLDGVFNDIDDAAGLASQSATAASMGFDGKTLIHPGQIDACNAAFTPSEMEVERARVIVEAFARDENRDKGVLRVEGRMVERLHLEQAKATLALIDAITG